jgi:transcriptional regulator with XRE-family HTH domain
MSSREILASNPFQEAGSILRSRRTQLGLTLKDTVSAAREQGVPERKLSRSYLSTLELGTKRKNGRPSIPTRDILEGIFSAITLPEEQREIVLGLYGYDTKQYGYVSELNSDTVAGIYSKLDSLQQTLIRIQELCDSKILDIEEILGELRVTRINPTQK